MPRYAPVAGYDARVQSPGMHREKASHRFGAALHVPLLAVIAIASTGATTSPSPSHPSAGAQSAPPPPGASTAPRHHAGEFFFDHGVQMQLCEDASPPMPLDRRNTGVTCWYAGTSCAGRGVEAEEPFTLTGTVVEGGLDHGGCNLGTYSLVYEPHFAASPARVRPTRAAGGLSRNRQ